MELDETENVDIAGGDSATDAMAAESCDPTTDFEAGLLQQFSCLNTTDKDVLIAEFQRLLGPNIISPEGCAFFLDMSNWNLQQAVCSYFDFGAPKDLLFHNALPKMSFIRDVTIGDGQEISPNTEFVKTWEISNSGTDRWPAACSLRFLSGHQMSRCDRVIVDSLEPNQSSHVSVEMFSPSKSGIYEGQWRMSTATGQFFGDTIWVIISVSDGGVTALTEQLGSLQHLGSPMPHS
ncbi:Protein NBR1 -like protein [Halotydeus destructor]|nr:Protein NBR1 -like protein [Halotydeus destructor]